ncbi:MAG: hypothetical protein ACREUM_07405, partial [Nitrosospira sp.]
AGKRKSAKIRSLRKGHNPRSDSWIGVERAVFEVQGKAQRRGMRPRRAEQCLPKEGPTPQRDAGTHGRWARSRHLLHCPIPLRGGPRTTLRGAIPFQVVAMQPCAAKTAQFTLEQTYHKGEGHVAREIFVDHHAKLEYERSTAGFRIKIFVNPLL